jgi:hypothetical protein
MPWLISAMRIVSDVFGVQEIASYISSKHEYSSGYCDKKKLC